MRRCTPTPYGEEKPTLEREGEGDSAFEAEEGLEAFLDLVSLKAEHVANTYRHLVLDEYRQGMGIPSEFLHVAFARV